MRLQERWRRVDEDTLELTVTLYDRETYTTPWLSDTKIYRRDIQTELGEGICVPSEEEAFNKRIRDPAGGVTRQ